LSDSINQLDVWVPQKTTVFNPLSAILTAHNRWYSPDLLTKSV